MSIISQNNRDLNQCVLHLWSKCGDPGLNGSQLQKLLREQAQGWHTDGQMDTQRDAGNDNTQG